MERTVSALASELLARLPSMAGEEQRLVERYPLGNFKRLVRPLTSGALA